MQRRRKSRRSGRSEWGGGGHFGGRTPIRTQNSKYTPELSGRGWKRGRAYALVDLVRSAPLQIWHNYLMNTHIYNRVQIFGGCATISKINVIRKKKWYYKKFLLAINNKENNLGKYRHLFWKYQAEKEY